MEGVRQKSNDLRQNITPPAGTLAGSKKAMRMTIQFNPNATFSDIDRDKIKSGTAINADACCQCNSLNAPVEFGDYTDYRGETNVPPLRRSRIPKNGGPITLQRPRFCQRSAAALARRNGRQREGSKVYNRPSLTGTSTD
jgi:hypothetical protein